MKVSPTSTVERLQQEVFKSHSNFHSRTMREQVNLVNMKNCVHLIIGKFNWLGFFYVPLRKRLCQLVLFNEHFQPTQ